MHDIDTRRQKHCWKQYSNKQLTEIVWLMKFTRFPTHLSEFYKGRKNSGLNH